MKTACLQAVSLAAVLTAASPAHAQQEADAASLTLELNALEPSDAGCRLSFVAGNGLGTDIGRLAFEMVLFDAAGLVERMTVLDLKDLPAGKTRVRRFDLAGVDCEAISRVLVNDAKACDGPPPEACIRRLKTDSKTEVPFSG